MKIASYNVNGINGRLPVLLRWLELAKPDVVCLQELKAPHDKFPEEAISRAGYSAIWQGQSRWNGVAILSRSGQIHETRRSLPGDPTDDQSRYLEAAIEGVLVANIYVPNGNPRPGPKFEYKLAWLERLHTHLASLIELDAAVVVAGDYNIIPADADVYAPDLWRDDALFVPEVKLAFARLAEQGWMDAFRRLHPDDTIYTFWAYWRDAFQRNAGLRIDHFLLNAPAAHRLKAGEVDTLARSWEKTSDHAPLWIELGNTVKGASA